MKKFFKLLLIVALIALVIMQFIRPDKNEGGYEAIKVFEIETKPSPTVTGILKENCYDCHSNHTRYPWYAEIAPFSYWLADHVKHGKDELNVSVWKDYSIKKKDHKLEEILEMIEEGEMPIDSYTWLHGNLSKDEAKLILQGATVARRQYKTQLEVSYK